MDFRAFKESYRNLPIITSKMVVTLSGENPQVVRNQLSRWKHQGLVHQVRKGMYVLSQHERLQPVHEWYVANQCYQPSYVSLESALSYYEIIPEKVVRITSITTKKTKRLQNACGDFEYRHTKSEAFRGFCEVKQGGYTIFLADKEKAIVDFLYFNLAHFQSNCCEYIMRSYRFQELHDVSKKKIHAYGMLFGTKKLMRVIKEFSCMLGGE